MKGCERPKLKRAVGPSAALLYSFLGISAPSAASTIQVSNGPALVAYGAFLNPNVPYPGIGAYSNYGEVTETPNSATTINSIRIYAYPGSSDTASYSIGIYQWSIAESKPFGDVLYQSPLIAYGSQDGSTNSSSPYFVYSTTFHPNLTITGGTRYFIDLQSNDSNLSGVLVATGTSSDEFYRSVTYTYAGLEDVWYYAPFDPNMDALLTDISYESVSAVPIPSSLPMLFSAIVGLCIIGRSMSLAVKNV